jgi:hypothetical protein
LHKWKFIDSIYTKFTFMKTLCLFITSLFSLTICAQEIEWINTIDGSHFQISKMITDSSNNIYIIGTIKGKPDFRSLALKAHIEGNGGNDIFIQKRNALYDIEWTKIIGGPYDEEGIDIRMNANGELIVLCNFKDELELVTDEGIKKITTKGEEDILFMKLDVAGRIHWARNFGNEYSEVGEHLRVSEKGDILIGGRGNGTIDFDPGNSSLYVNVGDYFFAQYDSNGYLIRAFGYSLLTYGYVLDVLLDKEQNIFITGFGSMAYDWPYPDACFIEKLDKFGNRNWFKYYDQNANFNLGNSLVFDSDSNLVTAGIFQKNFFNIYDGKTYFSKGASDVFFSTFNRNSGTQLDFKTFGDTLQEESAILIHDEKDGYLLIVNNNLGKNNNLYGIRNYSNDFYIYNYSLIKLNNNLELTKQLRLINNATVFANTVLVFEANSYLVCGGFSGRINFDPSTPASKISSESYADVFIQQWDTTLKERYTLDLGGTSFSEGINMIITDDGSVYNMGNNIGEIETNLSAFNSRLPSKWGMCMYIQKLDPKGNREWIKNIQGTNDIKGLRMHRDVFGELIITGSFAGDIQFNSAPNSPVNKSVGDQDYFILKLDAQGNFKWVKTFGSKKREDIFDSNIDAAGNIYIIGFFSDTLDFDPTNAIINEIPVGIPYNAFLQKLNANGNLEWVHRYDLQILLEKVEIMENGHPVLLGRYADTCDLDPGPIENTFIPKGRSDIFLTRMNSNGDVVWINSYGGVGIEDGQGLKISESGEIFITGYFSDNMLINNKQLINNGNNDIFILRINKDGQHLWSSNLGTGTLEQSTDLFIDKNGNYYLNCLGYGSIDVDPGPAEFKYTFKSDNSNYLIKYDNNNKPIWVYAPESYASFVINQLIVDSDKNMFMTGSYHNVLNCSFDVNEKIPLYNSSLSNAYLIKFDTDQTTFVYQPDTNDQFAIFPDPVNDLLNIQTSAASKIIGVDIYNLNGIINLSNKEHFAKECNIDVSALQTGLYFLIVKTESGQITKKFTKL